MMKNIYKAIVLLLFAVLTLTACDPQESNSYELGEADNVTADALSFALIATDQSENVITFSNTSKINVPHVVRWDLGNGVSSKENTVTASYPYAGEYKVVLTISTADGTSVTKTQTITIKKNDFSLINTPVYIKLTGGMDNTTGKTWVFDQYNNFSKEVALALGTDIKGHLGFGPAGSISQSWWGASSNELQSSTIYNAKLTFKQNETQLKIENQGGLGYGRAASASNVGGFQVVAVVNNGTDAVFAYNGGDYNFSINESGQYPKLTLSGNAFMGYYCGTQDYDIIYQTDKVMALRASNTVEGQDCISIFCLEELNVAAVKKPRAVELSEDFERATSSVVFEGAYIGQLFSTFYQNPAPIGINKSSKVCLYEKTNNSFSQIYFVAKDYKFDLSSINKVKMKVYFPSFNDYKTKYPVEADWVPFNQLQTQVSVRLQDSEKGANGWETQTEIVKVNIEKDKWVELVFDFSNVKDRKDYDKIVVQFGGEGHQAPGIFFFDDFKFTK